MALLEVLRIYKEQQGRVILDDISFRQSDFQQIAIAGESGAGKTTLLKIIGGLVQPDAGQVLFNDKKVDGPLEKLIPGHPQIAYLSQHFELRNNYRVEEILRYANELSEEEASSLYKICRIDHLLKRWTHEVSGGEKQRIALARLLTTAPKLLLLDEPFSNLDPVHKHTLKSVVNDLAEKLEITCLLTSHDPHDTLSWADEIIIMKNGNIIQRACPENIYRFPLNEYAAGLFGKYTIVTHEIRNAFKDLDVTKIFLRPEDLRIAGRHPTSLTGVTGNIHFMGGHYDVEVTVLENTTITARHFSGDIKKGQEVFLSLNS